MNYHTTYAENECQKLALEKKLEQGRKDSQPLIRGEKVILFIGYSFLVFMMGRIVEASVR